MSARMAADMVVGVHLVFILFVAVGGFFVLRWPKLAWAHLPAVVWGALIEFAGWICPLTPLENQLRLAGGDLGYSGGFVDRYIMPIVYPPGLTRAMQLALGAAVIVVNLVIYCTLLFRQKTRSSQDI